MKSVSNKTLSFTKSTVTDLQDQEMMNINGGTSSFLTTLMCYAVTKGLEYLAAQD